MTRQQTPRISPAATQLIRQSADAVQQTASAATTPIAKAEALETLMMDGIQVQVKPSWLGQIDAADPPGLPRGRFLMGDDPRLPGMPAAPTLVDFYQLRVALQPTGYAHMLQSASRAMDQGASECVILACLLHDIAVTNLIRADHGYWAAALIEPYVHPEVTWAVRYHQALRYFAEPAYNYDYPAFYKSAFGENFEVPAYLQADRDRARQHPWYDTAMQVVVNDFYAFEPDAAVDLSVFLPLIEENFKQPTQGLGFDDSPSAHMWRTMIWPNNFL
ncbi:MAG: hypothetical protein ACFHXK_01910 [bacterium]